MATQRPIGSLSTATLKALLLSRLTVRRRVEILRELSGRVRVQVAAAPVPAGLLKAVQRA